MRTPTLTSLRWHPAGRVALRGLLVLAALALALWASDKASWEGERTLYTVDCRDGVWAAQRCTGRLAAAAAYRFEVHRVEREVWVWSGNDAAPLGKLRNCDISDGFNWSCPPGPDAGKSVTLEMRRGLGVASPELGVKDLHAVAKLHWLYLRLRS